MYQYGGTQIRATINWTGLVLVLAIAPLYALYAQTAANALPPLQNQHRMTFKGIVRPAQAINAPSMTGTSSALNVPDLCNFEMMLKPGQNHVEARMVGPVRKTTTGCEADFDVGIPTVIQPSPQSLGASVSDLTQHAASSFSTVTGDVIEIGHSSGNAPDLPPIFGNSTTVTDHAEMLGVPVAMARNSLRVKPLTSPVFSSGYINGIVYDPIKLQVTYVNLYAGWVWAQTGTCVTNASYSQFLTELYASGWFLASNQPSEYTNCNGVVNYTYALFMNLNFCADTPTLVYYWPIQSQGWQDGTLYGNFAWQMNGLCIGLLTPAYQLNRSVN